MGLLDALRRDDGTTRALREDLKRERWQSQFLAESMAQLEDHFRDEGWRRMTILMDREFTRGGLDDLMKVSRAMYLSHPLIQRAVNVRAYYTWAQGVSFQAADDRVQEEIVLPLTEDPLNRAELYAHQARILTDTDQSIDGNTFFALATSEQGDVSPRSLPAEEVREIHLSPDDKAQVWFYRRVWNEQRFNPDTGETRMVAMEALYPDFRYQPTSQPGSIGGVDVRWDAPVIHQRTGGLKAMRFGVPETYAALDWARAYRKFLEDWHTIVASLSRFAWRATVKGSRVQATKTKFGSTITPDSPEETNRPPAAGSIAVVPEGADLTPIQKGGAQTSADDARASRLMVASAMDLPDTILSGDADQGNLATAKTLDRPTELAIRSRQSMWADWHQDVFAYAVRAKQTRSRLGAVEDPSVSVSFPEILEHDAEATVRAIVTAATLDGKVEAGTVPRVELSRMLLQALNVEDVEAVLEDLPEQEQADLARAVERLAEAVR